MVSRIALGTDILGQLSANIHTVSWRMALEGSRKEKKSNEKPDGQVFNIKEIKNLALSDVQHRHKTGNSKWLDGAILDFVPFKDKQELRVRE